MKDGSVVEERKEKASYFRLKGVVAKAVWDSIPEVEGNPEWKKKSRSAERREERKSRTLLPIKGKANFDDKNRLRRKKNR